MTMSSRLNRLFNAFTILGTRHNQKDNIEGNKETLNPSIIKTR